MSDLYDDADFDDDDGDVVVPLHGGDQYHEPQAEQILLRLRGIIEAARPVPLSASSMISKEEVLDLLDDALERLPEELRAARWLLKEREEFLSKVEREGDEIIDQARARAEQFVQRTEVVKAAEQRAYEIVDKAEADARRLRHEVEDFCDQKLGSFEIVLERTLTMVASGRAKLQGTNLTAGIPVDEDEDGMDDLVEGDGAYDDLPPPPEADWADELAEDEDQDHR